MEFQNQYQLPEIKKKRNYEMQNVKNIIYLPLLSFHLTAKNSRAGRSTEAEGKMATQRKVKKNKEILILHLSHAHKSNQKKIS